MMDNETRQVELQRLIDGNMPEAERVAYLECLDQDPHRWREVALTLIEEHIFCAAFSPVAVEEAPVTMRPHSTERQWPRIGVPVMAVSIILALFTGGLLGNWMNRTPTPTDLDSHRIATGNPDTAESSANDDDCYVLLVPAIEPTPREALGWDYIATALQQPILDVEAREAIQQRGYDVREEPVLYVVEDDNKQLYVLPQRHIGYVSHSES